MSNQSSVILTDKDLAKRRRHRNFMEDLSAFWFLLPIIACFVVLLFVPLMQTLYFSFTDFDGLSFDVNMVGFKNYQKVFSDSSILQGLGFTLAYAVLTTLLVTVIAIPLAVQLNKRFLGRNFARSLFFFLSVPSAAVLGMIWKFIFSPLKSGLINSILSAVGLDPIPWLSNSRLAQFCVIFVAVWAQIGWHATLYLAFLQSIPSDLYEQAQVDGASPMQQFVHITLPQLVPGIVTSTFLLMSGGLKVYDLPFTLTKGGPGYATNTVSQAIITRGIGMNEYGIASALSVLFAIAMLIVTFAQLGISQAIAKRFE
ncbi:binding-protein-dependent transporter inner membrane component [Bifidobacterium ramosum]|uniref:Binding-protein-dependent transporter inner membrane component n=2 Tax=Bifidobacterium ramosum TaxID=1798158 RepID=A0A6L4WZN3_9BIFI|nr:sugar ABC transporter permease [Bifidobacterium ramosum]KAB8287233.1 binding-protein-dependent transporter inner membrane component [Bifidobacterium ramosum]